MDKTETVIPVNRKINHNTTLNRTERNNENRIYNKLASWPTTNLHLQVNAVSITIGVLLTLT